MHWWILNYHDIYPVGRPDTHFFLSDIVRIKDEFLSYRLYGSKKKSTFTTKYVSFLSFVCYLLSQYAWRSFSLSHIFTAKGVDNSERISLGGRNWGERRRFLRVKTLNSELTSASDRTNGQNMMLFSALKRVATISIAAPKKSARASCTKTCTWKIQNRLIPTSHKITQQQKKHNM